MKSANWKDLLLTPSALNVMPAEDLEAISRAGNNYIHSIAHGISGIGNVLACTASNSQTGLSEEAVTDIGWMLEGIGSLISNLVDVVSEANLLASERNAVAARQGAAK